MKLSEKIERLARAPGIAMNPAYTETLREAAELARQVEGSTKAIGSRDTCTDECASIIMHLENGGRAKDKRAKWFHLVPVDRG